MAEALPGGAVIVPAYLRQQEDVAALARTLADLPAIVHRCIVVIQSGPAGLPSLARLPDDERIQRILLPSGVGKWPAFGKGLDHLAGDESWVAVVDGDGAFPGRSLRGLVEKMLSGGCAHVIGSRPPQGIDLRVAGTEGSRLRLHLEAFFNTLVLLSLNRGSDPVFLGADLQCGLHLFAPKRMEGMGRVAWPFYGGELQVFHDSVAAGLRVGFAPIEVAENPVSTYAIEEIVGGVLRLPCLSSVDRTMRERALREAPSRYAHWNLNPTAFAADLGSVLGR